MSKLKSSTTLGLKPQKPKLKRFKHEEEAPELTPPLYLPPPVHNFTAAPLLVKEEQKFSEEQLQKDQDEHYRQLYAEIESDSDEETRSLIHFNKELKEINKAD